MQNAPLGWPFKEERGPVGARRKGLNPLEPEMGAMTTPSAFVRVDYKFRDGWHVFTSADVLGLYVASEDAETAFDDVGPSIEKLVKLNDDIDCEVEVLKSYQDFVRYLRGRGIDQEPQPHIPHPAITSQIFTLRPRAA